MKKFTVIFVLCFLSLAPAAGQKWSFGVKGGINLPVGDVLEVPPPVLLTNQAVPFYVRSEDNSQGFYAGGFVQYSFSSNFALQTEVLFSRQNSEGKYIQPNVFHLAMYPPPVPISYKYTIDYLIVPMLAQYTLFKNLNVELGPQIGFLLRAENSTEDPNIPDDYKSVIHNVDFALAGGLTYTLFDHLDITARYQHGLGNAYKRSSLSDHTNRLFQLGVGYRF